MENQDTLDNKYSIIKRLGSGGQAVVYLVKEKNSNNEYAAKMMENKKNVEKEIRLNKKISSVNPPIPYIIRFITEGTGDFIRGAKKLHNQKYYLFEYASKYSLYKYIRVSGEGFGEKCGKLLFYKILLGVQALHKIGIYHLDLKTENIVFDKDYNPKICDFGLASDNSGKLNDYSGTKRFKPPQFFEKKEYSGEKADIFYLGSLLFIIVTGQFCFQSARRKNDLYNLIINNEQNEYLNILSGQIIMLNDLSQKFKNLFLKMISYEEENRPSIEDILKDKWFDDIYDKNEEKRKLLEKELNEKLIEKENAINIALQDNPSLFENDEHSFGHKGNKRGDSDEDFNEIFPQNLVPKTKKNDYDMDCYIKFKGNLDYYKFMNIFVNKIQKEFENENCEIDDSKSKNSYKCDIIFEADENEEEEDENEDNDKHLDLNFNNLDDQRENCIIQIKLIKTGDDEYVLRFLRKSGALGSYYSKVIKFISIAKNVI